MSSPLSPPPPLPLPLPPENKDADHLRILAIFHFIFAALSLLGIAFLFFHYQIMGTVFSNPAMIEQQANAPFTPEEFLGVFVWVYVFCGILMVLASILNLIAGLGLRKRRHRTLSFIVAGLNCLSVPLGTTLGIFTIIVLSRDSVRQLYDRR